MSVVPIIQAGGPWAAVIAVVTLVVVSLVRGWLVPGATVDRLEQQLRQRGDDWRDAYTAEVARGEVRDAQMAEILAFVRRSYPAREEPS